MSTQVWCYTFLPGEALDSLLLFIVNILYGRKNVFVAIIMDSSIHI